MLAVAYVEEVGRPAREVIRGALVAPPWRVVMPWRDVVAGRAARPPRRRDLRERRGAATGAA